MALGDLDTRWKNPQGSSPEQLHRWAEDLIRELRRGEYLSNAIGSGISNSQLADMTAWTIKMRNAGTTGDPQDVTINGLTEETTVDPAADFVPLWDASGAVMRKAKPNNVLPNVGLKLLASGAITNDATLDIVLTAFTTYRAFKIFLFGIVPATDDTDLFMRFSTNGGSTFDATGYSYTGGWTSDGSGGVAGHNSAAANQIALTNTNSGLSNVASEGGAHCEVTLFEPFNTTRWTRAHWESSHHGANTAMHTVMGGRGQREAAQDTNAVRFLMSSGNLSSGNWALYGLT